MECKTSQQFTLATSLFNTHKAEVMSLLLDIHHSDESIYPLDMADMYNSQNMPLVECTMNRGLFSP